MTAIANDEPNKDEVVPTAPLDLESVHEQTVAELEAEPITEDEEDEPTDTKDTTPPKKSDVADEGEPDDEDDVPDEPPAPAPAPKTPEPPVVPDKPIEVNTNIEENASGKVAIKDADGKTFYFNNTDEIPDDFEPESYKALMVGTKQLYKKEAADEKFEQDNRVASEQQRQQAEIDEVTTRWDKEQETMTKAGVLPADEKERENEVGDTYAYISKKLGEGILIESFAEGYKSMKYDQEQEAKAKAAKQRGEDRKTRGSKVMGGGGQTPSVKKEVPSLPPGTSLDAVHAHYAGLK